MRKILIVQTAALGYDFFVQNNGGNKIKNLEFYPVKSVFPALTCVVQASFKTGRSPESHGVIGNGFYMPELSKVFFWEQASSIIEGERIWRQFRNRGKTVCQLFWQQSVGTDSDMIISPAPIHKHHGGMIQDCYSKPKELYLNLCKKLKKPFNLGSYWGPNASFLSSEWIAKSTAEVMSELKPDLLLTYLPHLDYELQKSGVNSEKSKQAFNEIKSLLEYLMESAGKNEYNIAIFGDYAMKQVNKTIFPNKILKEAGLLAVRNVKGMLYPDFSTSAAFAVVDHQIAHIFVKEKSNIPQVSEIFKNIPDIELILDSEKKKNIGIDHRRTGDIVLLSKPGSWFSYYWWEANKEAPEWASHIDIHNKPGYDPCELFWEIWPFSISMDCSLINGSHGYADALSKVAFATDMNLRKKPESIIDLSQEIKFLLDSR